MVFRAKVIIQSGALASLSKLLSHAKKACGCLVTGMHVGMSTADLSTLTVRVVCVHLSDSTYDFMFIVMGLQT
jgi:hypothetical protein